MMTPFRIDWELDRPVVLSSDPLHLDGLLAYALVEQWREMGHPNPLEALDHLPLDRRGEVWAASQVAWQPAAEPQVCTMVRRYELEDIAQGMGAGLWDNQHRRRRINKIDGGSGRFKGFDTRYTTQWMKKVTAWGVGDIGEVEALLSQVKGLGRLARNGFGRIKTFTVQPARDEEADYWRWRILPEEQGEDQLPGQVYARGMWAVSAPYWDKTRFRPALAPISLPFKIGEPVEKGQ